MKRTSTLLPLLLLSAVACSHESPQAKAPRPTPQQMAREAASRRLEVDLVGWVAAGNLDHSLASLVGQVSGKGPGNMRAMLFSALGATPAMAAATDTSRPIVVAVLDPRKHPGRQQASLLILVPVTSRQAFRAALAEGRPELPAREGVLAFGVGKDQVLATFDTVRGGDVAYLTFDMDVAAGAPPLLERVAAKAPPDAILVHASMDRLAACCGDVLTAVTGGLLLFSTPRGAAGAYATYGMRGVRRALEALPEAESLELLLEPRQGETHVVLRATAKAGTPLFAHVVAQQPGPVWGAAFVPDDSMLVYSTRLAKGETDQDVDALSTYLGTVGAVAGVPASAAQGWHNALTTLYPFLAGETIYAVWPAEGGGIGAGGAFRVTDPVRARAALAQVYRSSARAIGPAVAHQLALDPKKFRFDASFRQGGANVGGLSVDVIEVQPRFPKGSAQERKMVKWLFGDSLVMGIAVVEDRVVWASGRDWRPRLEKMLIAGRGGATPVRSLAATPAFAAASRGDRVSTSYVPAAGLARFVMDALRASGASGEQEALLEPYAADESVALVATTRVRHRGDRAVYELDTAIPGRMMADLGGVGGAMWRVCMAPLFGAPAVPPLPAPPPTITPPAGNEPAAAPSAPQPTPTTPNPGAPQLPTGRGA